MSKTYVNVPEPASLGLVCLTLAGLAPKGQKAGVALSEPTRLFAARSCGFARQSHLTHRFKLMTTECPTRWRRRVNAGTLAS